MWLGLNVSNKTKNVEVMRDTPLPASSLFSAWRESSQPLCYGVGTDLGACGSRWDVSDIHTWRPLLCNLLLPTDNAPFHIGHLEPFRLIDCCRVFHSLNIKALWHWDIFRWFSILLFLQTTTGDPCSLCCEHKDTGRVRLGKGSVGPEGKERYLCHQPHPQEGLSIVRPSQPWGAEPGTSLTLPSTHQSWIRMRLFPWKNPISQLDWAFPRGLTRHVSGDTSASYRRRVWDSQTPLTAWSPLLSFLGEVVMRTGSHSSANVQGDGLGPLSPLATVGPHLDPYPGPLHSAVSCEGRLPSWSPISTKRPLLGFCPQQASRRGPFKHLEPAINTCMSISEFFIEL